MEHRGMSVLVNDYDPEWPAQFAVIAEIISEALAGIPHRIEHVGSTAVPGLAAKPIIDIDIVYVIDGDFLKIGKCLYAIGYMHNGDEGIPSREAFKRVHTNTPSRILDSISHHLYVCPADSAELR